MLFGNSALIHLLQWRNRSARGTYKAVRSRGCEFEPHLVQGLRMRVAFQSQKNLWDKIKVWFKIRLLKTVRGIPMQ